MKNATAQQQLGKLAEKLKVEPVETTPAKVTLPVKVKKEAPAATSVSVLNTSIDDDGERIYKCEQEGCFGSFKSRSSLRDHQKGELG